jgi:hypothetical protein
MKAAREAIDLALDLDPKPGRVRLLGGELAVRLGDASRVGSLLRDTVRGGSVDMYRYEWLLLNDLAGQPVAVEKLAGAWSGKRFNHWQVLLNILFSMQLPDTDLLEDCRDRLGGLHDEYRWDVHYYWMARAMIDGPGNDPQEALDWLEEVPDAELAGWFLPVELLRLRARAELGEAVSGEELRAAMEREIGELERLAPRQLHAWYMLRQARRDAAALSARDPARP